MQHLPLIDLSIIFLSFILLFVFALRFGKYQKNSNDYFLGKKDIPWWVICGSIVATETSTLSFIGVPAISFFGNLNFVQLLLGYILGRFIVSIFFLPQYFKGNLSTSYEFLEHHYSGKSRKITSVLFLITRLLGDGVRLFATAIPLKLLTGWSNEVTIVIIISVTIIFTLIGGIKTIVWTDFIQLIIYMGGAYITYTYLIDHFPSFTDALLSVPPEKLMLFDFSFSFENAYSFYSALFGGILLTISSHGTDQLIVQRVLTSKHLKDGQKALVGSGFLVLFQLCFFLILGLLFYAFYMQEDLFASIQNKNDILPYYVVHYLPEGISGLIIASIFAAAISTLSSSLSAMASASIFDFKMDQSLNKSRIITAIWGLGLAIIALFVQITNENVVTLGLGISSILYGGILSVFITARLNWKLDDRGFIFSLLSGVFSVLTLWIYQTSTGNTYIGWTFFIPIGLSISLLFAYFFRSTQNNE